MGDEAKKRGFSIKSHPKLIATKPLGILERTVDERNQSLFITEDLIHKGDIYIMFEGKRMTYHYEDESTFRMAIGQINDFMLREGYSKMDGWLKKPYFKKEDILQIKNDYASVYAEYKISHAEEGLSDGVKYICREIANVYDTEWGPAKKIIIYLAELLLGLMLDKIEDVYVEGETENWIFVKRKKNIERSVFKSPAKLVLDAYQYKDANQFFVNQVKRFLSESELKAFEENMAK